MTNEIYYRPYRNMLEPLRGLSFVFPNDHKCVLVHTVAVEFFPLETSVA